MDAKLPNVEHGQFGGLFQQGDEFRHLDPMQRPGKRVPGGAAGRGVDSCRSVGHAVTPWKNGRWGRMEDGEEWKMDGTASDQRPRARLDAVQVVVAEMVELPAQRIVQRVGPRVAPMPIEAVF